MRENSIPPVHLRLGELFNSVEDWRRAQPRIPARTDAIKKLLKIALEVERQRLDPFFDARTEKPDARP
jgi:hypothetical protein